MLRANDGFGEPRDKAKQPCLIYLSSTSTKWPFALHHTIHQSSLMLWWWWWLAWLQYDNLDFTFSPPTGMKSFLYAQLKDVCKPTPSSSSSSCCQWCLNFVGWVFFCSGGFLGRTYSNYYSNLTYDFKVHLHIIRYNGPLSILEFTQNVVN